MQYNHFGQIVGIPVDYWVNRAIPNTPKIHGNFCNLQKLNIGEHGDDLFKAFTVDQDEVFNFLPFGPFENKDSFIKWLSNYSPDYLYYTIIDSNTNLPQGLICFLNVMYEHGTIEIGSLIYSKALQKTRAGTEAVYLLLQEVFENFSYRRCQWKCNALNQASRSAASRFGFTFEGIFRQSNVFKGKNRDSAYYSILDSEWPDIKHRLNTWLSPDNFDNNGQQITSLRDIK